MRTQYFANCKVRDFLLIYPNNAALRSVQFLVEPENRETAYLVQIPVAKFEQLIEAYQNRVALEKPVNS